MEDDPDPTSLLKEPIFWLMMAVGIAVGFPLGLFFAAQMMG